MAQKVRIDAASHAALVEIARAKHVPLIEALARAVESYRRQVFLEAVATGYDKLAADPRAWAEERAERAFWDGTNADGLEHEPPFRAQARSQTTARNMAAAARKTNR